MLRTTLILTIVLLLVFIGLYIFLDNYPYAQSFGRMIPQDPVKVKYANFIEDYESYFSREFRRAGTPGAAMIVVKDTSTLFAGGFGLRKLRSKDSIDVNTVFRLGSLSKGFAAVLAGIMVDEKAFAWEDRVVDHLPYFALKSRRQTQDVQVTHILSHSTGLPYHAYTNLVESGVDVAKIAPQFRDVNLIGKPGEIYAYQNAAFGLIEEIILVNTQRSFQRQMAEKIFTPADMNRASISYEEMMSYQNRAVPHSFSRRKKNWQAGRISGKYYNLPSTGGINASILDMGNWLRVLLGNRPDVVSEDALDFVFQPFVRSNNENRYFRHWDMLDEAHYGMGWRVLQLQSDTVLYHGGFVNGYRSEIAFDRKEKVGICVLFNSSSDLAGRCIPAFWEQYYNYRDALEVGEQYTDNRN